MISARALTALPLTLMVLSFSSRADAYRPFDGTDADVAEEGEFELEIGPAYSIANGGAKHLSLPAMVLNLGFARDWELVIDAKNVISSGTAGEAPVHLDDFDILLKRVLRRGSLQEQGGISVATEFGPLLPNVEGEQGIGMVANLILSQAWDNTTLHLNMGGAFDRAHRYETSASLIVEGPRRFVVRPVAEFSAAAEQHGVATVGALLGAIWRISDSVAGDVALRGATSSETRVAELRLGITWGTPLWAVGGSEVVLPASR